jgi:ABC-type sugar transport system substrate-binding protein
MAIENKPDSEVTPMKKSLFLLLAAVLMAGLLLSACGGAAPAEEAAGSIDGKQVCYLIPDSGNSFLSALTESVKSKFAADGVEVLIYGAQGNAQTQYNQIENCIWRP